MPLLLLGLLLLLLLLVLLRLVLLLLLLLTASLLLGRLARKPRRPIGVELLAKPILRLLLDLIHVALHLALLALLLLELVPGGPFRRVQQVVKLLLHELLRVEGLLRLRLVVPSTTPRPLLRLAGILPTHGSGRPALSRR